LTFSTKTGRGRIVPHNEPAMNALAGCQTGHQHVFTYKRVETHSLTHAFKRMTRAAELPAAIHFHSNRHTFASWLVQEGVSIFQMGKLLGHTTTKTTEIYAHLQPETMQDVVDCIRLQPDIKETSWKATNPSWRSLAATTTTGGSKRPMRSKCSPCA
jgi:site-specific recombinase XerD